MLNNMYFNNKDLYRDFNCFVEGGIEYPLVTEEIEDIQVPNNPLGTLTRRTGNYSDLELSLKIRIVDMYNWKEKLRYIKKWFTNIEDNRLYFEYNLQKCLRVKRVIVDRPAKFNNSYVSVPVKFICQPFYFNVNESFIDIYNNEIINSDTDIECNPLIMLKANGNTQITINDTVLQFNYSGDVIIDSIRNIAYDDNKRNIVTKGQFPRIKEGDNRIILEGVSKISLNERACYFD